jgi:hypothetical protein
MKKLCFIELEGVLSDFGKYSPSKDKVKNFLNELSSFCKKNKIELFLISGHGAGVAEKRLRELGLGAYFDEKHFLHVSEEYISKKAESDAKLHRDGLEKDPNFVDTYFKQVAIQNVLSNKKLLAGDALLLSDDLWVDGYYTTRFSKIDFALFEDNLLDRGKSAERISGLAYFNLDFSSVKILLENFPQVNYSALDKYVFEAMKKVLVGDEVAASIKKGMIKRISNN